MTLRWYQREAVDRAWEYLCHQPGNPVIVAPTGAGKSHMIAALAREAVDRWGGRVMILAHRKELLEQNAAKIGTDAGLYSAGLKSRDCDSTIVVAGIQSCYAKAFDFGRRNLVLIDEVHLVPHDGEGMYRRFLDDLRVANPTLRMVGLTATPYRLDVGPLCRPDALFQRVCYSVDIQRLIAEGYLCELVSRSADGAIDSGRLRVRGGEFVPGEMEREFCGTVGTSCREIVARTEGRLSVLVFCSGVNHAEQVAAELERLTGEQAESVTGETPPLQRAACLAAFRSRELRWLVNCDVLTTGFDAPCIDAIAVLRATMSPGLFAQMVGRGFRVDEGKRNCLVLDFGENIKRHGPIDSPSYGVDRKRSGDTPGEAPTKKCPNCEAVVLAGTLECECGFIFPQQPRQFDSPSDAEILSKPETWEVLEVSCRPWRAKGKETETLRVDYLVQPVGQSGDLVAKTISEWVCVEHEGFARGKAEAWWRKRCREPFPESVLGAKHLFDCGAVARPYEITTIRDGRWHRIVDCKLDEIPEYDLSGVADDPFDFDEFV